MAEQYGPHTLLIEAELERFKEFRWLLPDTEEESLASWLEERFDEHLATLLPVTPKGENLPSPKVIVCRSVYEVFALIREHSNACVNKKGPGSTWLRALQATQRYLKTTTTLEDSEQTRFQWSAACDAAARSSAPSVSLPEAHRKMLSQWFLFYPPVSALRCHASWIFTLGTTETPWSPILKIWERGGWPIASPDGALIIFLPILHRDTIIPDLEHPDWEQVPRFRFPYWPYLLFGAVQDLGFGPLPCLSPPRVDLPPKIDEPPKTAEPSLEAPPAKVPWYKKIFGFG
jgi:hypothetical protein